MSLMGLNGLQQNKITHTRTRWGTPQKFIVAFTDELEKQMLIKKLLKWANKKKRMLIFLMLHF